MKTALSLPPTATPAQLLRLFTSATEPALMQPFLAPGKNGGIVSAASDGKTLAIWTPGKVGQFGYWASRSMGGESSSSPLADFRPLYLPGGSHPITLARPERANYLLMILGRKALLSAPLFWALSHCDSCDLGHSAFPVMADEHAAVSFKAVIGLRVFHGVAFCAGLSLPKP